MSVTWNPSGIVESGSGGFTLSNGNLTVTYNGNSTLGGVLANQGFSSGYWYFEVQITGAGTNWNLGWASASESAANWGGGDTKGVAGDDYAQMQLNNANLGGWYASGVTSGDWLAVAI